MTHEELIATAEVAMLKANKAGKDTVDLQKAINTLQYCIKIGGDISVNMARSVLLTEIEELKG